MDRTELADFLRRRREQLTPAEVGLPPGVRRRTPGLRRDEVALLAGMSTDYYTRLEQARGPRPSTQVLAALARACASAATNATTSTTCAVTPRRRASSTTGMSVPA
ncbi:putative MmyB family DNA-binding protein [Nocardia brasiliensis NBRC 14402]|nr:putative MmyB family DNA-binding protein [Nocardia brasiliensis NBRC 14402]SUB09838.1 Uncharacterised protein [Nocardia brasiliensis]